MALEFGCRSHVVTWRTSGHTKLLARCLPALDEEDIYALIKHLVSFQLDSMIHLLDLAGFHCTPSSKGGEDNVCYVQTYTTKKVMAYQQHQGIFSEQQPKALLSTTSLLELCKVIDHMSSVLYDCVGDGQAIVGHALDQHDTEDALLSIDDQSLAQDGCAHVEIRVPLSNALDALIGGILSALLRHCLVAIPSRD